MRIVRIALTLVVAALIFCSGYAALFIAPDEKTMHLVQRIFYFHVPSWSASFTAFTIVFVANIAYLATRQPRWDWLGVSAAEVGVAICSIGLITGPLWARPVWGIWWTWDARLTTTFILWLLYISYLILRNLLEDPERKAVLSAIVGIFAFLDVPLVYMSNRMFPTQHPKPVYFGDSASGADPRMTRVLLLCMFSLFCVMVLILLDRYRLERLRHECEELRIEVESRSAASEAGLSLKGKS
jgi:heme exporter protein C